MKYPCISAAAAAASKVFPQPGGPKSKMPLGQPSGNKSARLVGYTMDSRIALLHLQVPLLLSNSPKAFPLGLGFQTLNLTLESCSNLQIVRFAVHAEYYCANLFY